MLKATVLSYSGSVLTRITWSKRQREVANATVRAYRESGFIVKIKTVA